MTYVVQVNQDDNRDGYEQDRGEEVKEPHLTAAGKGVENFLKCLDQKNIVL
jgi:hypothetical protein